MAADYDLVILGGTLEGREAALLAARYGARVALVEPPNLFALNQRHRYLQQVLRQAVKGHQAQRVNQWFGQPLQASIHSQPAWNWSAFLEWSAIAADTQSVDLSVAAISAQGIDVVLEMPERLSQKNVVATRNRRIKASAVLAAFGLSPDVFTPLLSATQLPKSAVIWGGEVRSLLWAEVLAQLGVKVTLQTVEVLPGWDSGVQVIVRSQLSQAGVTLLDPAEAPLVAKAECTLFFGTEQPALSLPKFVYRQGNRRRHAQDSSPFYSSPFLRVNRKFQVKGRLFACGPIIEACRETAITHRQLSAAVLNALFLPTRKAEPAQRMKIANQFAMVGLTQTQAAEQCGDRTQVWVATDAGSTDLSQATPTPSYCQLVCVNRRLVGAHLVGDHADDCIALIAPCLGQPITQLDHALCTANFSSTSPSTLMNLVHQAATQHHQTQWEMGHWKRDWSENWFNWRRNR